VPQERSDPDAPLSGARSTLLLGALVSVACQGAGAFPRGDSGPSLPDAARNPLPLGVQDASTKVDADSLSNDRGPRHTGPFEVPFGEGRTAFVLAPRSRTAPARLIAMMHGVCMTPGYTCGSWSETATSVGFLVCPTGNATCDPGMGGGPTWEEPFADMDADLERSISAAFEAFPGEFDRSGAILAGFSRGAYMAVVFAMRHPGRWPFLILNEADVELTVPMMRYAGVRAVALIAGEWGAQIAGERKTFETMSRQGYPIRLWAMPKAGHFYSTNIESIMREAIDYVLAHEHDG